MANEQDILIENSRSVAFRDLPPIPKGAEDDDDFGTILLMYQYVEPVWTKKEHKRAIKRIIELGEKYNITGRGRVAPEGVNFTLSGKPGDIRSFCYALREWNPIFNETDFKLTDFIPKKKLFKSLSIRKTDELVAYGLSGEKAPSLSKFAGTHLEADEYHKAMTEKDTVIVDVRNAYESAIGSFNPPKDGAELIDPKMRNSIEFPKWLNDPATKEKLNNKKVLMYCTGGIRCERATALLNQIEAVSPELNLKGVYHMRGGIERYVKTFPKGGFWRGKNYLFDRRMEQVPGTKAEYKVESEIDSKCCLCRQKWTNYRGKFKCSQSLCGVPVIVCNSCDSRAQREPERLTCELCKEGYKAPETVPDLIGLKRKAEAVQEGRNGDNNGKKQKETKEKDQSKMEMPRKTHQDRLFIARLPLTITKSKLEDLMGKERIKLVHWLTDKSSGAFYGSCLVEMSSPCAAREVVEKASSTIGGMKVDKKRIKISFADAKDNEEWPPKEYSPREFPPVGYR